jgi:hypothetical protein
MNGEETRIRAETRIGKNNSIVMSERDSPKDMIKSTVV